MSRKKGATWTTAQFNSTVEVRGSAIEAAWDHRLSKLGVNNAKTRDIIRRQAIQKTRELSDVILRQLHVAMHTSPKLALQAVADDISNTTTERFNLYRKVMGPMSGLQSRSKNRAKLVHGNWLISEAAWGGSKENHLCRAGPVRNSQPTTNKKPSCHASQNRVEYNSADSRRNISQARGGYEGGEGWRNI